MTPDFVSTNWSKFLLYFESMLVKNLTQSIYYINSNLRRCGLHIKTVVVAIHKNWELVTVARHRLVQAITVVVATEHQVDACFIQKR